MNKNNNPDKIWFAYDRGHHDLRCCHNTWGICQKCLDVIDKFLTEYNGR